MVYSIEEIKRRVTPIAEKYKIPAIYLFGSYARGTVSSNSDIDLFFFDPNLTPTPTLVKP